MILYTPSKGKINSLLQKSKMFYLLDLNVIITVFLAIFRERIRIELNIQENLQTVVSAATSPDDSLSFLFILSLLWNFRSFGKAYEQTSSVYC